MGRTWTYLVVTSVASAQVSHYRTELPSEVCGERIPATGGSSGGKPTTKGTWSGLALLAARAIFTPCG